MLFRYPGGKGKIANYIVRRIIPHFDNGECDQFIEPFFGSGAITFEVLSNIKCRIWINDIDRGISCVWNSVIEQPDELIAAINQYTPTVEDFFLFKKQLSDLEYYDKSPQVEIALKKIAIHQMSFSGLGTKAGSPIGGKNQFDADGNPKKYQVDCRWSPKTLAKNIKLSHKYIMNSDNGINRCTSFDYSTILSYCSKKSFVYLDPPYYDKGEELYQCAFDEYEHIKLAGMLKEHKNWLLSYDNCDEIKELYNWANIEEVGIRYTINNNTNHCKELLISPK